MSAFDAPKKAKSFEDEDDDVPETASDIDEEVEGSEKIAENEHQQNNHTPRIELQPSDFYFGGTLGEGAFARVVHAKSKKNSTEFAVKIMEKMHIKRENKAITPAYSFFISERITNIYNIFSFSFYAG